MLAKSHRLGGQTAAVHQPKLGGGRIAPRAIGMFAKELVVPDARLIEVADMAVCGLNAELNRRLGRIEGSQVREALADLQRAGIPSASVVDHLGAGG